MKKLRVTVEPFQGTIPFRILQRGRVLVEGSFSGKCTQLHSRTFQVITTNEELTVECTMNAAKCRMPYPLHYSQCVERPYYPCAVLSPHSRINRDRSPTGRLLCASVRG